MSDVIIYGPPQSTYVRTALMVLIERGVPHRLEPVDFRSAAYRALHPFGKVPAMRHGEVQLFETLGIVEYVENAFAGLPLRPNDAAGRGAVMQWVSAIVDHVYPALVRRYLMLYVRSMMSGEPPDRAAIDAALPTVKETLGILDAALAERSFLAGDRLSIADLFLQPIIHYMNNAPESGEIMKSSDNLRRWFADLETRPSVRETVPPPVPSAKAA
jgi:glutathione S-transferase